MRGIKIGCILLIIMLIFTGCGRYTFFNELKNEIKQRVGKDPYLEKIDTKMESYSSYDRPLGFTKEALEGIAKLTPAKKEELYHKEDDYETVDISTIEAPKNPYEIRLSDPDQYVNGAEDFINAYFNYFVNEAGGYRNAPIERKIDYIDVTHNVVIAGDIEEFAIETIVEIHVPNVQNTIYSEYGIAGRDGAIHCEFTIHGRQISDYTFELVGIVQSERARTVIDTDIDFVRGDPQRHSPYDYKIEEDILSVTYDGGKQWNEVPISMDQLFARGDGNGAKKSSTLESGSYFISPELTAFIYGGSSDYPVTVILSKDGGKTWTKHIVNDRRGIRRNFISIIGQNIYVLSSGDRTMSQEFSELYVSKDEGETWERVAAPFPEGSFLVTGFTFLTDDLGFITVKSTQSPSLYRTEDGGTTWNKVEIEHPKYYTMAYAPEGEKENLILYVGVQEYGEMEGILRKYRSEDQGLTWIEEGFVLR